MSKLLTAAQMRAVERHAIDHGITTGRALMERAGQSVIEAIFEQWPALAQSDQRAVVLCGPGNNGGDGFVVARLLQAWGWHVEVFFYGDAQKLPCDAQANYTRWCAMGKVHPIHEASGIPVAQMRCDLMVDALFGTGLARPIEVPCLLGWLSQIDSAREKDADADDAGMKTVAIDIPSGLGADTGRVLGEARGDADGGRQMRAPRVMLSVTFHARKLGHVLAQGPELCGRLVVKDIGLGGSALKALQPQTSRVVTMLSRHEIVARDLSKTAHGHKYAYGHALVLCGPAGHGGAARLAARGALRIGAGVVSLGCPHGALQENAAQMNAIMLAQVGDPQALTHLLEDPRITALCLGPGLGGPRARALLPVALKSGRSLVLDADALTLLAQDDALFAMLPARCVLTPHAGEFARLFPDIAARLHASDGGRYSKVDATREAAKRAGCVVLLKGADTVIGAPDGRARVNAAQGAHGAPWLATAGSGDVLAGFITGLMARGFNALVAAETGAWLHTQCARAFGPGLIAEDIPEALPGVFRALAV